MMKNDAPPILLFDPAEMSCAFCQEVGDGPAGKLLLVPVGGKVYKVHSQCLTWAPLAYESKEGGWLNVATEVARARRLRCSSCGLHGAALGCEVKACRRSFHVPCSYAAACSHNEVTFTIRCPDHAENPMVGLIIHTRTYPGKTQALLSAFLNIPCLLQDEANVCGICQDGGSLLICDGPCRRAYHLSCIGLQDCPGEDIWLCGPCARIPGPGLPLGAYRKRVLASRK